MRDFAIVSIYLILVVLGAMTLRNCSELAYLHTTIPSAFGR